ncbi:MAG: LamG domain-containing protein [Planctomycetes bacterium]|nr:LamG domain-containing protein [Planctomycetota bacterium]
MERTLITDEQRAYAAQAVSVLLAIGAIALIAWQTHGAYTARDATPDLDAAREIFIHADYEPHQFKPEPAERLAYLLSLLVVPTILLLSNFVMDRVLRGVRLGEAGGRAYLLLSCGTVFLLYYEAFMTLGAGAGAYNFDITTRGYGIPVLGLLDLLVFALAAAAVFHLAREDPRPDRLARAISVMCGLFVLVLVLGVPLTVVFDETGLMNLPAARGHFRAVFYSVVQVYFGKAVLVDTQTQYGLYAHLLEPLFRLIGLSVFTFTATMATLLAITFGVLALFLRSCLRNRVLACLGLASIVFYHYVAFHNIPSDPYFQYGPLRTLFPVVLVYLVWRYVNARTRVLYYANFLWCALGVLWNLETGVICCGAWLLVLLYAELFQPTFASAARRMTLHVLTAVSALTATLACYGLYVYIRYGGWPDPRPLLDAARVFYGCGFYMLPMPPVYAWRAVVLIYIIGLSCAARAVVTREAEPRSKMVFFLCIMGAGLFAYYQGRSHELVIKNVAWPAIVLAAMFADRLLAGVSSRSAEAPRRAIVLIGLLCAMAYPVRALLSGRHAPLLIDLVQRRFCAALTGQARESTPFPPHREFVRDYTSPGDKVIILSADSDLLYLDAGVPCAADIPGWTEAVLKRDVRRFVQFLTSDRSLGCKIFLDTSLAHAYNQAVVQHFQPDYVLWSGDGRMVLLSRRGMADVDDGSLAAARLQQWHERRGAVLGVFDRVQGLTYEKVLNRARLSRCFYGRPETVTLGVPFAIEVILRPASDQVPNAHILGNHPGERDFAGFVIQQKQTATNRYCFGYGDGSRWHSSGKFALQPNRWSHLVVTTDGRAGRIYINGECVQRFDFVAPLAESTLPVQIGDWTSGGREFNGSIRSVRIYSRDMGDDEIARRWAASLVAEGP